MTPVEILSILYTYFCIPADEQAAKQPVFLSIINMVLDLQEQFEFADSLVLPMIIEDVSKWLQQGNDSFEVNKKADVSRYSQYLQSAIKLSMPVKVF